MTMHNCIAHITLTPCDGGILAETYYHPDGYTSPRRSIITSKAGLGTLWDGLAFTAKAHEHGVFDRDEVVCVQPSPRDRAECEPTPTTPDGASITKD